MANPYSERDLFTENYDVERLRLYLENGGNPNIRDSVVFSDRERETWENTPLIFACDNGNEEAVRLLLEYNADVNAQDWGGISSLHILATHRTYPPSIAKLLIENGADIEIKDQMGSTPLLLACSYRNMEMIEVLVDSGADIHATDRNGDTCLHISHNKKVIVYFLEKGLDPNIQNHDGNTVLYATFTEFDECNYNHSFRIREKYMNTLHLLIEYGCDIFIKNKLGKAMIDYCPTPYIREELIRLYSEIECSNIKEPSQ
jgi:ankyrin repeat protein